MKTLLFSTMHIKDNVQRYQKYMDYYKSRCSQLGASNLIFIDDGSERRYLELLQLPIFLFDELPENLLETSIITFRTHLGRPERYYLQGWWRSFLLSPHIAERYEFDKLVHIESDAYILSDRLFKYIEESSVGWVVLWCSKYEFPETSIQIINKDSFAEIKKVIPTRGVDKLPEYVLPFTFIEKGFKGDRYGEYAFVSVSESNVSKIPDDADFSCQSEYLDISKWL